MVELFTVLENGHLEVNFEALELKTSAEFVEDIKKGLSNDYKETIVKVIETDYSVTVKTITERKTSIIAYKFYKKTRKTEIDVFGYSDVFEYLELGGKMPNE